ncbi:MAG: zinc ribbon domain-containing protein [Candidatus Lokiarchaeota archaeon]|nr:zinc ribbon domain-containing protein [Candidatus Lokiarchaeota archaeon]
MSDEEGNKSKYRGKFIIIPLFCIGAVLLITGIIIAVYNFNIWQNIGLNISSMDSEASHQAFMLFAVGSGIAFGGGACFMGGFGIFNFLNQGKIRSFFARETAQAVEITATARARGMRRGLAVDEQVERLTEGFSSARNAGEPKQIIKIKCGNCGYLETEDADFCSKCGEKL